MFKKILLLMVFMCQLAYSTPNPITAQSSYRWRNDDGNQVNATYKENVNTAAIVTHLDEIIRLRIAISETNNTTESIPGFLQYKRASSATWSDISTAITEDFYLIDSNYIQNNNTTSQQISSGSFSVGRVKSKNNITAVSINGNVTEFEFVMRTSSTYDENETYEFRVSGIDNYNAIPILNTNVNFCNTVKPTVSNNFFIFEVGDAVAPLMATGTNLLWYASEFGGTGSATATIPDTSTEGITSYWVSQTDNGCESLRTEIKVAVRTLNATGKSLHFDGVDDHVLVSNFDYSVANTFTLDFWVKPEKTITIPTEGTGGISGSTNQSYAIFPTLPSVYMNVNDADNAMAGVSVGTNGIAVFEHRGGHLPALLSWTSTVTDWTRVTVVFDNKVPSLYVNGVFEKTGLTSPTTNVYPGTRDFGTSDNATHATYGPFQGSLDKLYILNKAVIPVSECEPAPVVADIIASYDFSNGVAGSDNSGLNFLIDETNSYHGELYDFTLNGSTSNWLADSYNTQFNLATVSTPVVYSQGDTATPLTATTGENGLLWYDNANEGVGVSTAPTPDTSIIGNTSYWVSSTTVDGCESERVEIVVTIVATPATHLNFDGSNDVINLGSNLTTSFTGKTAFTLEAWVKPETTTGLGVIVGNYDYPSTSLGMQMLLRKENSNYTLWMDNGTGFVNVTQPNTVVLNTWQHIAGTWDGSVLSLYIDGVLVNSSNVSGTLPSKSTTFSIGSNGHNEAFNGAIDEVRIWDVTRTVSQINSSKNCELQGDESGLVSYFKFNQGLDQEDNTSETTLLNSVSGATNGTLLNFALTGATSNWLAGSPVTSGSIVPSEASVTTPVMYNEGDMATPLTATTGANGSGLLWYTMATGGSGSTTAPTPSTATVGDTSYWVSSTNANGCESKREEIVVTVNAVLGIGDFITTDQITLYPNPTSNVFKIKGLNELAHLTIYNLAGKQVLSVENYNGNDVQTTNLASGMYLVAIETAASKQIIKLVIN